jgi:hypothetical protein
MRTTSNKEIGGRQTDKTIAPGAAPAKAAKLRQQSRVNELLGERLGTLPVWIRSPKSGLLEFYTGFSRSKLYEEAAKGNIRSVSIREPGQVKGTRLFELNSILAFIEKCEAQAMTHRRKQMEAGR